MPDETDETLVIPPPAVQARGLTLEGPRGRVYGPLDLDVPQGWLVALVGAQGTGRTAALLTIAGRMGYSSGELRVLDHDLPRGRRAVQSHCAIAGFDQVDVLDEGLTLGELAKERAGLSVPLWRRPMGLRDDRMLALARLVFAPASPPDWETRIFELTQLQLLQARLLLALIGDSRLLVVDDVDTVRDPDEQRRAWQTLQRICGTGVTVVASATATTAIPGDISVAHLNISLRSHLHPRPATPDPTTEE